MDTALATRPRYRNLIFDSTRWAEIGLRPGDIVVSTPPKSGTTWMQVLCGLLVFDGPRFPAPLEQLSPWVDMLDKSIAAPGASRGFWHDTRRFIRTGGTGEWRAWTTPADEDGYRSRVASLVEPALARWVHEGGATASSC